MRLFFIHVPAICLLTLRLTQCVEYKVARKIEITEQSTTINVFPTDETWNSAAISAQKRIFTESAFSKASFSRQCAHELELTPIYYRTGETVRIECFMCSIALVFNGEPKGWARVKSINDFFGKGHKFGSNDGPEIEMVQNAEYLEDENIKENPRKLGEPYYYQEDGFLVIEKANSYSQGVYFCFDEDSVASQRNFYILIPILPVVHIAKKDTQDIDKIKKISGDCSESPRSYPNHFSTIEVETFDDQDTCFKRNGHDDWTCYDGKISTRFPGCENPAVSCRTNFSSVTLPVGTSLSISINWSPWSECEEKGPIKEQRRKGECFIKLDRPIPISESLPKKWSWLKKLTVLTNHIAFRDGIPLFSGLLASWLYGVNRLEWCLDTELKSKQNADIQRYNDFFRDVFISLMNKTDELKSPESPFKYCLKHTRHDDPSYDALIGTYTEDKRSC